MLSSVTLDCQVREEHIGVYKKNELKIQPSDIDLVCIRLLDLCNIHDKIT